VLLSYGKWRKYVTIFSSQHLSNDQLLDSYRNWYCNVFRIEACNPENITGRYKTVEGKITKKGIFKIQLKCHKNPKKIYLEDSRPVKKRDMDVFPSFMVYKNGTLEPWDQKQAAVAVMSIQNYPLELPKDIRRKIAEMMMLSTRPTFHKKYDDDE
jgi:hypothetical protein